MDEFRIFIVTVHTSDWNTARPVSGYFKANIQRGLLDGAYELTGALPAFA